jgi:prepilin-type N-terminal cleavage/methylation domain-containing protein
MRTNKQSFSSNKQSFSAHRQSFSMKRRRIIRQSEHKGFTLIELLVVIAIIVILALAALIVINPIELLKRGRDATRVSDLQNLHQAISAAVSEASGSTAAVLCYNTSAPCSGASTDNSGNARSNNGTGWVKVNLSNQALKMPVLSNDPINDSTYHYNYNSDGSQWEFNAVLESDQYKTKMSQDGGNNDNAFEVGTSLTLIN